MTLHFFFPISIQWIIHNGHHKRLCKAFGMHMRKKNKFEVFLSSGEFPLSIFFIIWWLMKSRNWTVQGMTRTYHKDKKIQKSRSARNLNSRLKRKMSSLVLSFSPPHCEKIHFSTACWFQVVKKQLKASPPHRLLRIVSVYMWHFRRLKCFPGVSTWY